MIQQVRQMLVKLAICCLLLLVVFVILMILGFPRFAAFFASISSFLSCLFVWATFWKRSIVLALLFAILSVIAWSAYIWAWGLASHLIA